MNRNIKDRLRSENKKLKTKGDGKGKTVAASVAKGGDLRAK